MLSRVLITTPLSAYSNASVFAQFTPNVMDSVQEFLWHRSYLVWPILLTCIVQATLRVLRLTAMSELFKRRFEDLWRSLTAELTASLISNVGANILSCTFFFTYTHMTETWCPQFSSALLYCALYNGNSLQKKKRYLGLRQGEKTLFITNDGSDYTTTSNKESWRCW